MGLKRKISQEEKDRAVARMVCNEAHPGSIASELGIGTSTAYRWLAEAIKVSKPAEGIEANGQAPKEKPARRQRGDLGRALEAAGPIAQAPSPNALGGAVPPPRKVPTGPQVVAYCQSAVLGVGAIACAALKVEPDERALGLFAFSREEKDALLLPAEAAAPDIADLLGSVKYLGLVSLGVPLLGIVVTRLLALRAARAATVSSFSPPSSPPPLKMEKMPEHEAPTAKDGPPVFE